MRNKFYIKISQADAVSARKMVCKESAGEAVFDYSLSVVLLTAIYVLTI